MPLLKTLSVYVILCPSKGRSGCQLHHPRGGEPMPIIITLHIFGLVVTVRIKKQSRHSAK